LHLAISPDGNTLAVCSSREEITFYDMRNWKTIKQIRHKEEINALHWDQGEGNLLFAGDNSAQVCIFDGKNSVGQLIHTIEKAHNPSVFAIAVDTRNRYFMTGGTDS